MKEGLNIFIKNLLKVSIGNIISLLQSVITGLIVPLLLGTTDYGYYRMFMLYATYTALLHFGFIDGILLRISGKKYNNLNKKQFRTNSISFMILELIVSLIIIMFSIFIHNRIYSFLFMAVGINTFISNVFTYYQFIAQATMRFTGYSVRGIIQASLNIFLTLLMWLLYKLKIATITYTTYIWVSLFIASIMFFMCIYSYRDITFGKHDPLINGFKRIFYYCKIGIYLTIAYQVSNLIMIIDNQFVSIFFRASTYGKYAFSYNIMNTAIGLLSAIATVMLPHLKRSGFNHIIEIYHKMIGSMMLLVYLSLLAYFPLCFMIKIILPSYIQSLSYLRIFLPELGITCSVTMITFNYYNALNKSKFYFYMCLGVLSLATIIDALLYLVFYSAVILAFGSLIATFIWYMLSEYFLVKWYHVRWIKNYIYMILMITSFLLVSGIHNIVLGVITYVIIYTVLSVILYKSLLKANFNKIIDLI